MAPGAKAQLRAAVQASIAALPPARRALEEEIVQAAVQAEDAWRDATTVLVYRAIGNEFSVVGLTLASWRAGKRVAFPRVADPLGDMTLHEVGSWSGLTAGTFGIPEPASSAPQVRPGEVELALVPGIAFDKGGGRLGRGRGYYDRLIPMLGGPAWGVAYDCQVVEAVPAEPHDRRVARVVHAASCGLD